MKSFKLIFVFSLVFILNFLYSQDCIFRPTPPGTLTIGSIENVNVNCNLKQGKAFATFNIVGLTTGEQNNVYINLPIFLVKNNSIIWQGNVNVKSGNSDNFSIEIPNSLSWSENDMMRIIIVNNRYAYGCVNGVIKGKSPNCPTIYQGGDLKCIMKDIKADFYLEQTKTNGETIIINTVPKTTSGVEHYWGIVGNGKTPNCNCSCEDISLDDIKNAKTTGVWATHIKSDGTFENIGIGTNVTAGTSGYGIKYGGFPYYGCYKITHYIICDKRVESFTTCVNQSSNNK